MDKKTKYIDFVIVFTCLFFKYLGMWNFTSKANIYMLIIFACCFSLIFLMREKFSIKQIKKIVILSACAIWILATSSAIDFVMALLFALMFCNKENGDYKFLKYYAISSIVLFIGTIFLNFVGVLENNYSSRIIGDVSILRNNLGFAHVNAAFMYFLPIFLSALLITSKSNRKFLFPIVAVLSAIIYYYTRSRTGILIIVLAFIFYAFKGLFTKKRIKSLLKYQYIIFTVIPILMAIKLGSNFSSGLNESLSFRLFYWKYYLDHLGISISGQDVLTEYPLDNMYLTYLISYGIISYIIYLVVFMKSYKKFKDNKLVLITITLFNIYSIFENMFVYCNSFALILQLMYLLNEDDGKMYCLRKEEVSNE